ncbi:MAG: hypothetical protein ABS951_09965 [Solibacillus sp.]
MKKIIIIAASTLAIVLAMTYTLVTNYMLNTVQQQITENDSEIENILTINRIGSWGEWFSEYVLVVEIEGELFRIWVNADGEIVEKEALHD